MPAGKKDFILQQGSKFVINITIWDDRADGILKDLTGYTAAMQLRDTVDDASTILSLTSPSSGITINTTTSVITVTITAVQAAAITTESMCYDLEITPSSGSADTLRILEGSMILSKEVTR